MTGPHPPQDLSFEDALAELERIVSQLERGETPLEETIASFERGVALSRRCEDRLGEAEKKVALLLQEGRKLVEIDLASGERLSERPLPDEDAQPAAAEQQHPIEAEPPRTRPRPEPAARRPAPSRSPEASQQQPLLPDADDDIPF